MSKPQIAFQIFILCMIHSISLANDRYWIGTSGGDWNTPSYWSSTPGGATDNILPTSSDDVYFDENSGNGTITVNSNEIISNLIFTVNCQALILDISSGELIVQNDLLTQTNSVFETVKTSGGILTVQGNAYIYGGFLVGELGTINVYGSSGLLIGDVDSPGKVYFSGATINIGDNSDESIRLVNGSGCLNISSGVVNVKNHVESITGDSIVVLGGILNVGAGTNVSGSSTNVMFQCNGTNVFSGGVVDIQHVPSNGLGTAMAIFNTTTSATGGLIKVTAINANYKISPKKVFNLEINSLGVVATFIASSTLYNNLTVTNGTVNLNGYVVTTTNIVYLNGGIFQANSGTLNINGNNIVLSIAGGTANFGGGTINVGNGVNESIYLYSGSLNISAGTINVKNYVQSDLGSNLNISGGVFNIGTGGTVSNSTTFKCDGTNTFTGGTVDVKKVLAGGSNKAIDISANSSATGGLIKITATNANYQMLPRKIFNIEIIATGVTATLVSDMQIFGDFRLTDGSFASQNGFTATFAGSVVQNIIGSSADLISFYNLTMDNVNGLVIAPVSGIFTTVLNNLTFNNGTITIGNYNLNIGASGVSGSIINSNSSKFIITNGTGVLKQFEIGTSARTSVLFPVGFDNSSYSPLLIDVSGSSTIDNFSVRVINEVLHYAYSGVVYNSGAVDRTWFVTEGVNGGSNNILTFQWNLADELPNFNRSNIDIRICPSSWTSIQTEKLNGSNPYKVSTGVLSSFSEYALFDAVVLGLNQLTFDVEQENDKVKLNWKTDVVQSENYYILSKSSNGFIFNILEKINGDKLNNVYLDENELFGVIYYQLELFNQNGELIAKEIKSINFENKIDDLKLYPNPFIGRELTLCVQDENDIILLKIMNLTGEIIFQDNFQVVDSKISFYPNLKSGIYIVSVINSKSQQSIQLIVE
ncbi:MAG: hypothetical protein HYR91_08825 [Flavobacteriia bacterium]|nr:hypothetical protein [Flavobacteriia bacterium]